MLKTQNKVARGTEEFGERRNLTGFFLFSFFDWQSLWKPSVSHIVVFSNHKIVSNTCLQYWALSREASVQSWWSQKYLPDDCVKIIYIILILKRIPHQTLQQRSYENTEETLGNMLWNKQQQHSMVHLYFLELKRKEKMPLMWPLYL